MRICLLSVKIRWNFQQNRSLLLPGEKSSDKRARPICEIPGRRMEKLSAASGNIPAGRAAVYHSASAARRDVHPSFQQLRDRFYHCAGRNNFMDFCSHCV